MALPDQVKLRILFNIPDNETNISGGVIIDFSEFEFGSDDDRNETVTYPSGFSFEFVPDGSPSGNPPSWKIIKKVLRQLKQSETSVYVYKRIGIGTETLFFWGIVDRDEVECDPESKSIKVQVNDFAQQFKDTRSDTGHGYELDPEGDDDLYHPAKTFVQNEANRQYQVYSNIVCDSNIAAGFHISGSTYYASFNGHYNASIDKTAYLGFINNYLFSLVSGISPKRIGEVLKQIANCFCCTVVPGYEGKLFLLQRFRNVNKSPITITDSVILEHELRIVSSASAMYLNLWKNFRREYYDNLGLPTGSYRYNSIKGEDAEDVRMPFGSLKGQADIMEEEMMFYRPPYQVPQFGTAPYYIDYHAGFMALIRNPLLPPYKEWDYWPVSNSLFEIIGEAGNYSSVYYIYAAKIWPQLSTPRLNYVLKVSGTNWALDSYYYVPIDESGNTTVYRCRKIKYDFKEGTTTLDLIEFIESTPDPGSAEYPLLARPGTSTIDSIIMSDNY